MRLLTLFLIAVSCFGQMPRTGGLKVSFLANHSAIDGHGLVALWDMGAYPAGSASQTVSNIVTPGTYDLQRGSTAGVDSNDFAFTGNAASFDGVDDEGLSSTPVLTAFTLLSVGNTSALNGGGLVGLGEAAETRKMAWLEIMSSGNLKLGYYSDDVSSGWTAAGIASAWSMLAVSADASYLQRGYVNGGIVGSYQASGLYAGNATAHIGRGRRDLSGTFVSGLIAQSCIYNTSTSAATVARNYRVLKSLNAQRGITLP